VSLARRVRLLAELIRWLVHNHQTNGQRGRRYLVLVCSAGLFVRALCSVRGHPQNCRPLGAQYAFANSMRIDRAIRFATARRSGYQPMENGRSGYAEEEDHEQDCERTVWLEPIDDNT
jgi:hypothetical protein